MIPDNVLRSQVVTVKGLPDYVIRELTGADYAAFRGQLNGNADTIEVYAEPRTMAALVALGTFTQDGERVFATTDEAMELPLRILLTLSQAVLRLSGLDEEQTSEVRKNSSPTPPNASGTS